MVTGPSSSSTQTPRFSISPSTGMTEATSSLGPGLRRRLVSRDREVSGSKSNVCCWSGLSPGEGRNVNIAWSASDLPLSDAEYLAAMRTVVCPIVRNFNPGVVLISAGFDATQGHPPTIGGYNVSPACFASMTSSMLQFAEGKAVLALEGGYVGPAVAESVLECLKVLLAESCSKVSTAELERTPLKQAVLDIEKTIANLVSHF